MTPGAKPSRASRRGVDTPSTAREARSPWRLRCSRVGHRAHEDPIPDNKAFLHFRCTTLAAAERDRSSCERSLLLDYHKARIALALNRGARDDECLPFSGSYRDVRGHVRLEGVGGRIDLNHDFVVDDAGDNRGLGRNPFHTPLEL